MEAINFCYWLQGYFELGGAGLNSNKTLSSGQVQMIKEHLALVFHKVTPSVEECLKSETKDPIGTSEADEKIINLLKEAIEQGKMEPHPMFIPDSQRIYC